MTFILELIKLNACEEAINWLETNKFTSLQEAWQVCKRADWMLWLLWSNENKDEKKLTLTNCEIARTVLHIFETKHPNDKRPRICLDLTEKWYKSEDNVTYDNAINARKDCWNAYFSYGGDFVSALVAAAEHGAACSASRAAQANGTYNSEDYYKALASYCDIIRKNHGCPNL